MGVNTEAYAKKRIGGQPYQPLPHRLVVILVQWNGMRKDCGHHYYYIAGTTQLFNDWYYVND